MLIIENLFHENNQNNNLIKIDYAKFNNGEAVEVVGIDNAADIFFNILTGNKIYDGFRFIYDDEIQKVEKFDSYVHELSDISYLYPDLTAKENIYYFSRKLGLRSETIKQKLNWLLHFFDLYKSLDKKIKNLTSEEVLVVNFLLSVIVIPKILVINCDFPKNPILFPVENYVQIFRDLQKTGTIFFFKSSWFDCFKDHKLELVLSKTV